MQIIGWLLVISTFSGDGHTEYFHDRHDCELWLASIAFFEAENLHYGACEDMRSDQPRKKGRPAMMDFPKQIVKVVRGIPKEEGSRLPVTIWDKNQRHIKYQFLTKDQEAEYGDASQAHYVASFDGKQWWLEEKCANLDW